MNPLFIGIMAVVTIYIVTECMRSCQHYDVMLWPLLIGTYLFILSVIWIVALYVHHLCLAK